VLTIVPSVQLPALASVIIVRMDTLLIVASSAQNVWIIVKNVRMNQPVKIVIRDTLSIN